jgi:hypothetical protein
MVPGPEFKVRAGVQSTDFSRVVPCKLEPSKAQVTARLKSVL